MRRLVGLAGLIVVVLLLGAAALLAYTVSAVDKVQGAEERAMVARALRHSQEDLAREVTSQAYSNQAYANLASRFDPAWADQRLGMRFAHYFGYDVTLVLGPDDAVTYAWLGPKRSAPAAAALFAADLAPLIAKGREAEQIRGLNDHDDKGWIGPDDAVTVSGIVASRGRYYMVSLAKVTPQTLAVASKAGPAPFLVSAQAMDADYLSDLQQDLNILDATILRGGAHDGPAATPLVDVNGFVAGALTWQSSRPGVSVLLKAMPFFLIALVILAAAGWAMTRHVRAILRELAAGDAALATTLGELIEARDMAQGANTAKSQFLANMSHEIRTPLNGVLGMAQVMSRDVLDPRQADRLKVIQDSGETLLTVLNDILDFSKIEAGKLEIDPHEFDLADSVILACSPFANLAARKDIGFDIDIAPEALGVWRGDAVRLRQMLSNLASNAVKFTAAGKVAVVVEPMAGGLRFKVRDTGIGIPEARREALFHKFSQVDASTTRRFGGTGLGLAISHELAGLMGGRLTVESTEGQGSTFILELPLELRAPSQSEAPQTEAEALKADGRVIRVLAAEDNAINQIVLRSLLEPLGIEVTIAANGREAVAAFQAAVFDVVLMDIQMPDMNGVEATIAIRAFEAAAGRARTPVLALSANAMSHQVSEYLDVGMDGFVSKPIEAAKLAQAITEALGGDEEGDLTVAAA